MRERKMVTVPYVYMQDVPIDGDVYRQIIERIGTDALEGCLLHLCVRTADGGLRYLDIWESEAACTRAFDDRIHPAVHAVFTENHLHPAGEPDTQRLHLLDVSGSMVVGPGT